MREWIERLAGEHGGQVAIEDGEGRRIFYHELPEVLGERCREMPESGIFAVRLPTGFEMALWVLAAGWKGLCVFPVNARWTRERFVFFAGEHRVVGGCDGGEIFLNSAAGRGVGSGTMICTSGSSGEPKVALHRWGAHFANAEGTASVIPLGRGDKWLIDLPLWHVSGIGAMVRALHFGAVAAFGAVSGITHRSVVATQLYRLLAEGERWEGMKAVLVGGGAVSPELRVAAVRSGCPLYVTYGMTETASQISTGRVSDGGEALLHSGRVLPGREVRLGEGGAIEIRGEVLFEGYVQEGERIVREEVAGGWFRTKDVGRWGRGGELVVLGREDRMFVCGGENIYPEKIEAVVLGFRGVEAAVVVGREDEEYGERPVIFLKGRGSVVEWKELLRKELTGFEVPVRWLAWPREVEVRAGGKGQWRQFSEWVKREARGEIDLPDFLNQ